MTTGLMFFDDSDKSLAEKVRAHAARYFGRFGKAPELCLVHPSMLADVQTLEVDKITIRPWRYVMPNNFWLGIEEMPMQKEPA